METVGEEVGTSNFSGKNFNYPHKVRLAVASTGEQIEITKESLTSVNIWHFVAKRQKR
jgi:hypothetical protein